MKTEINKLLLIVPCYNEEKNILSVVADLKSICLPGMTVKILPVNDASTDRTAELLQDAGIDFITNPVNLGIGGTVQTGFIYALENDFDIAIQVDGDGQHPASEVEKIVSPFLTGEADMVVGSRFVGKNFNFRSTAVRRVGIRFFSYLNNGLAGIRILDSTSGFRGYNKIAMKYAVEYYPDEYPEPEMILYLAHKKMRITEVPVRMRERDGGVSSINSVKSVYYMAKVSLNILFLHIKMKFNV